MTPVAFPPVFRYGCALLFASLIFAVPVTGAILTVTTATDDNDGCAIGGCSLRDAIVDANSGDTIEFDPTLAGATILLSNGQLLLNKNLTVDGSGVTNRITIAHDTNGIRGRLIQFNAGTTSVVENLIFTGGHAQDGAAPSGGQFGGGIYNSGDLTLRHCMIRDNRSGDGVGRSIGGTGGGIYSQGSLHLEYCEVIGNRAGDSGYNDQPSGLLPGGRGGGIACRGSLYILHSSIISNQSGHGGNSVANSSSIGGEGGGVYIFGSVPAEIHHSTISHNRTGDGGVGEDGRGGRGDMAGAFIVLPIR